MPLVSGVFFAFENRINKKLTTFNVTKFKFVNLLYNFLFLAITELGNLSFNIFILVIQ